MAPNSGTGLHFTTQGFSYDAAACVRFENSCEPRSPPDTCERGLHGARHATKWSKSDSPPRPRRRLRRGGRAHVAGSPRREQQRGKGEGGGLSHENFPRPCSLRFCEVSYFKMSWNPGGPLGRQGRASTKSLAGPRVEALVQLDLDHMDDGGMYVWAVILAIVGLAAGYGFAILWQRWKDQRKARGN